VTRLRFSSRWWLPAAIAAVAMAAGISAQVAPAAGASAFAWPPGVRAAVSLSFDDARASQLDDGVPLLGEYKVRATFYLSPANMKTRAGDWKAAAAAGHEMGNHSMTHPCSGNFAWSRARALEDFTLERIERDLSDANRAIEGFTGVTPATFAYPCGQTFVGRAAGVQSYVPVVSRLFLAGRGWLGESPNDPGFVDLAQVLGYPMDDVDFESLRPVVDDALARGQWLVLAGHDIGTKPGRQVTRVQMLRDLLAYLQDPSRGVWIDTVERVARHIDCARSQ
jgi:peptidoglycan-N-acetylglucosamine deacetylase